MSLSEARDFQGWFKWKPKGNQPFWVLQNFETNPSVVGVGFEQDARNHEGCDTTLRAETAAPRDNATHPSQTSPESNNLVERVIPQNLSRTKADTLPPIHMEPEVN